MYDYYIMELLFENGDDIDNTNELDLLFLSNNIHANNEFNWYVQNLQVSTSSVIQDIFRFLYHVHDEKCNISSSVAAAPLSNKKYAVNHLPDISLEQLNKNISRLPQDVIINHIFPFLYQPQSKELMNDIKNFHETKCFLIEKICKEDVNLATRNILNVYSRTYVYSHANSHVLKNIDKWYVKNRRVLNLNDTPTEDSSQTNSIFKIYFIHYPNILQLFESPEKWIFLWAILPPFIRSRYLYLLYTLHSLQPTNEDV